MSERRDVHDYVKDKLGESDVHPETNPEATFNLIVKACSNYVVGVDHDQVEDYEYHYITIVRIADQIYGSHRMYHKHAEELISSVSEIPLPEEELVDYADRSARYVIGNTITLVYSMAYEFVNDMLGVLITNQIRDDVPDTGKNAILSQISSYLGRAEALVACDVISTDQLRVIKHINEVRRDLVHDVEERFTLSVMSDLNEVNRIPHLLNDLYEMVYDEPAVYYYDDLELKDLLEE